MKVSLVVPNVAKHIHGETFEPLGILYIASRICGGHDVQIIDAFSRRLSIDEALKQILDFSPEVVGISLTMSPTVPFGRALAQSLKELNPALTIVIGGTHATFSGFSLASYPYIDVVVLHEGEEAFAEILECVEHCGDLATVEGLVISKNGIVEGTAERQLTADLDSLSFPARHLLPDHTIYKRKHILSSRGCVFKCIYCASSAMNRHHWRPRNPANVLAEIEIVASQYCPSFYFADDNFPINRQRALEICKGVLERGLDINWACLSRIELIDDSELLAAMARSGCREIFIGAESGSDRVLEKMNRKYTAKDIHRVVEMCRKTGISTTVSFIVGNPFEQIDDVRRTFDVALKLHTPNVAFHIFTPYLGTQAFSAPEKYGLELLSDNPEEFDKNREPVIETQHLSKEQIMELYCESFGVSLKKARQRHWWSSEGYEPSQ